MPIAVETPNYEADDCLWCGNIKSNTEQSSILPWFSSLFFECWNFSFVYCTQVLNMYIFFHSVLNDTQWNFKTMSFVWPFKETKLSNYNSFVKHNLLGLHVVPDIREISLMRSLKVHRGEQHNAELASKLFRHLHQNLWQNISFFWSPSLFLTCQNKTDA